MSNMSPGLPDLEPKRADLRKGLSERIRHLAFGILAIFWAIAASDTSKQSQLSPIRKDILFDSVLVAVLTLVLDFLQELFDYSDSAQWLSNYRLSRLFKPATEAMFALKILSIFSSVILFLFSMFLLAPKPVHASFISPWQSFWGSSGKTGSNIYPPSIYLRLGYPKNLSGLIEGCYADSHANCTQLCKGTETAIRNYEGQDTFHLILQCGGDHLDGSISQVTYGWIYMGTVSYRDVQGLHFIFKFLKPT